MIDQIVDFLLASRAAIERGGLDPSAIALGGGVLLGAVLAYPVGRWRGRKAVKSAKADAEQLLQSVLPSLQEQLGALSTTTLKQHVEEAVKDTRRENEALQQGVEKEFGTRTELLDKAVRDVREEMARVQDILRDVRTGQNTTVQDLATAINRLNSVFSNEQARGKWAEDQTERLLKLLGFKENVDYVKQQSLTDEDGNRGRPDITVRVAEDRVVHIDSKFPLKSYWAYCDATDEVTREKHKKDFLTAVRGHIRDIRKRPYFDKSSTVGYVLVYISIEQVFAFLNEHAADLIDEALDQNIVVCTTPTLYAILSVVHRFMETQRLEKRTDVILQAFAAFNDQWSQFTDRLDTVRKRMDQTLRDFDELNGTRRKALERPLSTILEAKQTLPPRRTLQAELIEEERAT